MRAKRRSEIGEEIKEWMEEHKGKHFCKCGCGKEIVVSKNYFWIGIPEYTRGHHPNIGAFHSEKQNKEHSEKMKIIMVGKNKNPQIDQWIIEHTGKHFCKHCGEVIKIRRCHFHSGIPKYIKNHKALEKGSLKHNYNPEIDKFVIEHSGKHFCKCGCGKVIIIEKRYYNTGIPDYIWGHNPFPLLTEEGRKRLSERVKKWNNEHPDAHRGKNNPTYGKSPSPKCGRIGKGCYYDSLLQGKIWLRSSYELAFAKYLDLNNEKWLYESKRFDLGDTTYCPDFYFPEYDEYIEIKGYMNPKAKEKINKFRIMYPDIKYYIMYRENLQELGIRI